MKEKTFTEGMAFGDFLNVAVDKLTTFAIHLVAAILVFYIGRFIVRKLNALVQRILTKRHVDASIASFVKSATEIVLYFVLIIAVIGILGIETSSFIALFASAGVAVGMALSGTLQNFAGGVLILSLRPYSVGDYIEAQGYAGTVKAIQMFSTVITTPDNKTIIIPNGPLSNGSINNYSKQDLRRVDWTVATAYGTNFETAKAVILEILGSLPQVINTPGQQPAVYIGELADSSVNITVRAWVKSADYWDVFFTVNQQIYETLPSRGVEFPFPQLDVHIGR
ncbi:MAG: mechanosensitive ion channel [Bacteroides sp.]|nr:mechanosensitive ion channel [Bacteroides sp.]MCM1379168.1 mechanosensitive ion channel [Bacteroides sp.]MCM1445183.1 mechanosensitive ion channel [Prevotella sp.]